MSLVGRRSGPGEQQRAVRVEAGERGAEVVALLRGLRAGALYELRVRVFTRFGEAPAGRAVSAQAPLADALTGACRKSVQGHDVLKVSLPCLVMIK